MRLSSLILLTLANHPALPFGFVLAQDIPPVQELHGSLAPGQNDVFLIAGLKKGQTLDAFMENTSGNLDPVLSILPADENLSATLESFKKAVAELAASSEPAAARSASVKGSIRAGLGRRRRSRLFSCPAVRRAGGWRLFPARKQLALCRWSLDRR